MTFAKLTSALPLVLIDFQAVPDMLNRMNDGQLGRSSATV